MDLLFFWKSGLLYSTRRWKFAFNKNGMFLLCVAVIYFILFFFVKFSWLWVLPLLCYLLALGVTLVVPNDAMFIGKGKKKERLLVYALGDCQFGAVYDGIFIRTHGLRIVNDIPITVYKRRFGDKPMMLIQQQENHACYVYSEDYPLGLYLGYAVDEDMVVFQDHVFHETFMIEPGRVSKLFDVKRVVSGQMVYSDFWNKAAYYRSDAISENDVVDDFGYKELCYHYQIDTKHFLLVEFDDNWFKLFFVLINGDDVIEVLEVRNVDEMRFVSEDDQTFELRYDATKEMYFLG